MELAVEHVREIAREVEASAGKGKVTVDLEAQAVTSPSGRRYAFAAPGTLRDMLLKGVDEIELTLGRREEIERFREHDRARRPWAY